MASKKKILKLKMTFRRLNMAENGAALQGYNNELVKCIEDLCVKRDDVSREIKQGAPFFR